MWLSLGTISTWLGLGKDRSCLDFTWRANSGHALICSGGGLKPGACHTDAKGYLVHMEKMPRDVTKQQYLITWESDWTEHICQDNQKRNGLLAWQRVQACSHLHLCSQTPDHNRSHTVISGL